jgi:hypothetical protein
MPKRNFAILSINIDRQNGREVERKVIGHEEIDEDVYYRPLVEMFGKRVLDALRQESKAS